MAKSLSGRQEKQSRFGYLSIASIIIAIVSSLFWAWLLLSLFEPIIFLSQDTVRDSSLYNIYLLSFLIAASISAFVSIKLSTIVSVFLVSFRNEALFVIIGSIGNIFAFSGFILQNIFLTLLGGIVIGISSISYMLAWARMYAREGSRSAFLVLCTALTLGIVCTGLTLMLPLGACMVLTTLLPLLILSFLFLFRSAINAKTEDSRKTELTGDSILKLNSLGGDPLFVKPQTNAYGSSSFVQIYGSNKRCFLGLSLSMSLAIPILGFIAGNLYGSMILIYEKTLHFLTPQMILTLGLLAFFLCVFIFVKINYGALYLLTLITLGIAGFIFYKRLVEMPTLFFAFIFAGFFGLYITIWCMLTELSYLIGDDAAKSLGVGAGLGYIGMIIGYVLSIVQYLNIITLNPLHTTIQICAFLFMVVILLIFLGNQRLWLIVQENTFLYKKSNEHSLVGQVYNIDIAQRVEFVSNEKDLTSRESDVLELLLIGRSRPRIAQSLSISESTVSTHVQNIYKKFKVHGLQELIDVIVDLNE